MVAVKRAVARGSKGGGRGHALGPPGVRKGVKGKDELRTKVQNKRRRGGACCWMIDESSTRRRGKPFVQGQGC